MAPAGSARVAVAISVNNVAFFLGLGKALFYSFPVDARGTLDVLSLNNPSVHNQLRESGAQKVLDGLGTMGSGLLRDEAGALGKRLGAQSAAEMSRGAHVKAAKATRVRYDNVRRKAIQMMGGWERGHGASGRGRGRGGPDDEE